MYKKIKKYDSSEYDLIVCSGGDGTFDEVVTGNMSFKIFPARSYNPYIGWCLSQGTAGEISGGIKAPHFQRGFWGVQPFRRLRQPVPGEYASGSPGLQRLSAGVLVGVQTFAVTSDAVFVNQREAEAALRAAMIRQFIGAKALVRVRMAS